MPLVFKPKHRQLNLLVMLLCIVVAALMMLRRWSHTPQAPFQREIVKSGGDTIDIAIELNPTCYAVKGDSIFGRDYQRLMLISEREGVAMKFHPFVPLRYALDGLNRGDFDMVVASLPLTTEMRDSFLMTDHVFLDKEVLVQLRDADGKAPVSNLVELGGDTVWISADSPFATRIRNLSEEIGDTIHVMSSPDYSSELLFILTAKGDIPRAVVNEAVAKSMHESYPQVNISTAVSFTQFQSWAIRRDNKALCDSVNAWLARTK